MNQRNLLLSVVSLLFYLTLLHLSTLPATGDERVPAPQPAAPTVPDMAPPGQTPSTPSQQDATARGELAATATYTIGANFSGATYFQESFFRPPDTMGAVGPTHVVELINGYFGVYDRSGNLVQGSSLDQFWQAAGVTPITYSFDPRIIYDAHSERWFATAVDNPQGANHFLVAVSETSDPTGDWSGWAVDSDADDTHWADFPMLGLNGEVVVISANMFPLGGLSSAVTFLILPKADLLAATPTVANNTLYSEISPNSTGFSPQPIYDLDGSSLPLPILSAFNKPLGDLKRSSVSGSSASPSLDTSGGFMAVTPRNAPPDVVQPDPNKMAVDAGDTRFSGNVVLQQIPGRTNPSIWAVEGVSYNSRAAVEWYEIDAVTNAILQSGLIADTELAFNYPSIAVNDLGEVVVGFSGGSGTLPNYVSTYVVVGTTESGTTTFSAPYRTKAGVAGYEVLANGDNRWGDYSATVVDPTDERRFWTFQEFVSAEDRWTIQITEIILSLPAVTPTLTITQSSGILSLTWPADPDNCSYEVYSSTTPYSGFSLVTTLPEWSESYTPPDNGQQQAYFYVEAVSCIGEARAASDTVGWFRFDLVPGS